MDEDTRELVQQLCTRAGMMMEDASLLALTMPNQGTNAAATGLARLERDTQAIAQLVAAAVELAGRAKRREA